MRTRTFNRVEGLNRCLRDIPKEASKTLRDASVTIAEDIAVKTSRRAGMVGGVAKYVPIKARRDRVPKIVMGGTTNLPGRSGKGQTVGDVMWGAEFGSDRHRQFSPWRGSGKGAGYFLWPTVRDESDTIMDRYADALGKAIDRAG